MLAPPHGRNKNAPTLLYRKKKYNVSFKYFLILARQRKETRIKIPKTNWMTNLFTKTTNRKSVCHKSLLFTLLKRHELITNEFENKTKRCRSETCPALKHHDIVRPNTVIVYQPEDTPHSSTNFRTAIFSIYHNHQVAPAVPNN